MGNPTEIQIKVPWGTLGGLTTNRNSARKILALHGWQDNAATFLPLLEKMKIEAEIVCLDLPGHGRSDSRPLGTAIHFTDFAADVQDVLDQLKWDRCHIIGHSWGACIAALYASLRPDVVTGLVLLDAIGPWPSDDENAYDRIQWWFNSPKRNPTRPKSTVEIESQVQKKIEATPLREEIARLIVERNTILTEDGLKSTLDSRLKVPFPYRLSMPAVQSYLRKIVCPTLCFRATPGIKAPDSIWKNYSDCIPDLALIATASGHYPHVDNVDEVALHATRFLQNLNEASALPHAG